jgi:hypothetical protein
MGIRILNKNNSNANNAEFDGKGGGVLYMVYQPATAEAA